MSAPDLVEWMRSHPPARRGPLASYIDALQQLARAGYTHNEMRTWLASQGVTVSRQAITKALATHPATDPQPVGNLPATTTQGEATSKQPCKTPKSPGAAPSPAPDATLKERAQAVGDRYLNRTLNPLTAHMLASKINRKT